jgi:hypothetical protein
MARIIAPARHCLVSRHGYNLTALSDHHRAGGETPAPATLSVHRTAPDDIRDRQVIFSLDGEDLATLLYGEHVTRPIAPGAHRLRANNTLVWKTLDFEAAPGEHVCFQVVNRAAAGTMWMVGLIGVGLLLLRVERCDPTMVPSVTR